MQNTQQSITFVYVYSQLFPEETDISICRKCYAWNSIVIDLALYRMLIYSKETKSKVFKSLANIGIKNHWSDKKDKSSQSTNKFIQNSDLGSNK